MNRKKLPILLSSLALAFLSACSSTAPAAPTVNLSSGQLSIDAPSPRAQVQSLSYDASSNTLSGEVLSSYPQLPADRALLITLPDGSTLEAQADRSQSTKRLKRPIRSHFSVQLP